MVLNRTRNSYKTSMAAGHRARGKTTMGQTTGKRVLSVLAFSLLAHAASLPVARDVAAAADASVGTLGTLPDDWIPQQVDISYQAILENIGADAGALPGLIIASPSKGQAGGEDDQPNYFYTWTRDSALTIITLLPHYLPEHYDRPWTFDLHTSPPSSWQPENPALESTIVDYISSQRNLQTLDTRSGNLWTGGLSEPKYNVDGTAYTGEWGRPQRDGPALRALAVIPYAHYLLDKGSEEGKKFVKENLYDPKYIRQPGNLIKNDLEEVAAAWYQEGFDLWEETKGHHLFTRLASLRALQAGAILAARLDDPSAAEWYAKQADRVEARLANFWVYDSHKTGYWANSVSGKDQFKSSNLGGPGGKESDGLDEEGEIIKGLDCGFTLSVIHAGQRRAANSTKDFGWTSFEPSHPGVLSTLRSYALSFSGEYPINRGNWTDGWLVGRYRGDTYDGIRTSEANPWFICTHSFSQVLYLAYESYSNAGAVKYDHHSVAFWSDLLGKELEESAEWPKGSTEYEESLDKLWDLAETYLDLAHSHAGSDGSMSEQIDKVIGYQRGARQLTWSHASLLDVARARRKAQDV